MAAFSFKVAPPLPKPTPSSLSWTLSLSSPITPHRTAKPHKTLIVFSSLNAKPTILVAEKLGQTGIQLLKTFANVDCSYDMTTEDLCAKISLCDALIVRSATKVTRQVFESSGGRLKVVGRAGVGIDNVDLAAATEHGCLVVNAPTANTIAAAEHGIALITAMARNIAQADASVKAGMSDVCFFFYYLCLGFWLWFRHWGEQVVCLVVKMLSFVVLLLLLSRLLFKVGNSP